MEITSQMPYLPAFILFSLVFGLASLALVTMTAFLKIVVVIHILKNAIGLQQAPPTTAINALSLILTIFIMAPVGKQCMDAYSSHPVDYARNDVKHMVEAVGHALTPLKSFLKAHASQRELDFFTETAQSIWPEDSGLTAGSDSFLVLVPSFAISELRAAFEAGFLIYLPFLVIDIIVSNVLLSLGMIMLSPITISLPFKLLLFVFVDGWSMILHGLVRSYG